LVKCDYIVYHVIQLSLSGKLQQNYLGFINSNLVGEYEVMSGIIETILNTIVIEYTRLILIIYDLSIGNMIFGEDILSLVATSYIGYSQYYCNLVLLSNNVILDCFGQQTILKVKLIMCR
jgi:hypothetical protein